MQNQESNQEQAQVQTPDQIENQKLITENPDIQIVDLDEPIKIGNTEFTQIEVRKPSVPALRKIRISEILNGDVNSICTILPLCTTPTLSQGLLNSGAVEPADIVQLGAAVIYFLQPKSVRAELSLQQ
ncbi:phage tail assembly protein [Acinetobacter sp. WCHAc010034]|uniref:phage tail assembly protein n=1 Tax=Acinetobacter sp. WCHAc010034 TaxID=1879049 RepID=UPI00083B1DBB|nr:phage tail assembly protein [Acinetobacter sp. WCHAc010034]AYA02329.1 phage tail assembly protein [Acinetobacter sp. WCHAc010034]